MQAGQAPAARAADVYVVVSGARATAAGIGLVERLRDALPARRFDLNLGGGNFKAQFRRADRSGAALAVILGDDELARGVAARETFAQRGGSERVPAA